MNERIIRYASRPLRFIPTWMQGAGLGIFLDHVVESNPDFRERLVEVDDNHFLFEATDIGKKFYLHIKDGRIRVKVHHPSPPDVIMKGEFSVLVGLLLSSVDPDTVFFSRRLQISGNTATALCFKNILDSIE